MTPQEIQEEILKCKQSPYYFATKYLTVKNHRGKSVPFTTLLSEEEFNKMFKKLENYERNISNTRR
jgi:hypothetical protein